MQSKHTIQSLKQNNAELNRKCSETHQIGATTMHSIKQMQTKNLELVDANTRFQYQIAQNENKINSLQAIIKKVNENNTELMNNQQKMVQLSRPQNQEMNLFGGNNDALNKAKSDYNALNTRYQQLLSRQTDNVNNMENDDVLGDMFSGFQVHQTQALEMKNTDLESKNELKTDERNVYLNSYKERRVFDIPAANTECMFVEDTLHCNSSYARYCVVGGAYNNEEQVTIQLVTSPIGSRDNYHFGFASEMSVKFSTWDGYQPSDSVRHRGDSFEYGL